MYFLIELAKVIRNCTDREFAQYVSSFGFFSEKNKILGEKWEEYLLNLEIEKGEKSKEWHRTIREIRNWEDQELDYMYQRIMALSRQILGNNTQYFTVETFSGQLTVPDRMQVLNRLVELSNELIDMVVYCVKDSYSTYFPLPFKIQCEINFLSHNLCLSFPHFPLSRFFFFFLLVDEEGT